MARPAGYLLDTNVISETVRARPDAQVMRWLDALPPEQLHVSVLSLGEIRKGVLMAQAGQPLPAIDSLLAATALKAGLAVATRNVRDFERMGVAVVNPWDVPGG